MQAKKVLGKRGLRTALVGVVLAAAACTPAQWRAAQNWNDTRSKTDPFSHCTWHWRIDHWVDSHWRDRNGNDIYLPVYRWLCDPDGRGWN